MLLVEVIGAQEDVLEIPIVIGLADAGRALSPRGLGAGPLRELLGRGAGIRDRGVKLRRCAVSDAGRFPPRSLSTSVRLRAWPAPRPAR